MGAVWMRARAELRARRMAIISAGLLCGLFGAAVLAGLAGARRTQSAYPRFLERQRASDMIAYDATLFNDVFWKPDFHALASLPYVETAVRLTVGLLDHVKEVPDGIGFWGSLDPAFEQDIDRPLVVHGRLPDPDAPDEVAVPYFADATTGAGKPALGIFRIGDSIRVEGPGSPMTLKVVGETVFPAELPPMPQFGWNIVVSRAFLEQHASGCVAFRQRPGCDVGFTIDTLLVRFEHPSDIERFGKDVKPLTGGKVFAPLDQASHARAVQGSTDLQAAALRLLAIFVAVAAALITGQLLAREAALGATDADALRALGFDRPQLFALGLLRTLPVSIIGAVIAVTGAWLASPLFPQGSVRLIETRAPVFDTRVLSLGGLGVLTATLLVVVVPAWRVAPSSKRSEHASRAASVLTSVGASVPAVAGARLALERGRGRTAVPVVSSLAVIALGIASLVAADAFSASMRAMIEVPSLHGVTWDTVLTTQDAKLLDKPEEQEASTRRIAKTLASDADIVAIAGADSGAPMRVFGEEGPERGIPVLGLALDNFKGSLFPPVAEGRVPAAPDEVNLGPRMMRALGLHLNPDDPPSIRVTIEGSGRLATFHVVGRAVIPPLGNFGELGYGIVFASNRGLASVLADSSQVPPQTDIIVRWRPGVEPADVIARYHDRFPALREGEGITGGRFADAVNFGGVQAAPLWVGGVLAALGAAALAHVLITAIRRRRRDVAILKTIGFVRGQARRTVAWQATIMVLVAAFVGMPLGIIGGRTLWRRVADGLGVLPEARTSWVLVAVLPVALVVLANLIAVPPSRAAANVKPASVLRSE